MKPNITEKMHETYLELVKARKVDNYVLEDVVTEERNEQYEMLTHPRSNNKTNAVDLAILAWVMLDEAYFSILLEDTDSSPLTSEERELMETMCKSRATIGAALRQNLPENKFWNYISAVTKAMDC